MILIFVGFRSIGQLAPVFSQYHVNQYLINPAYGGLYKSISLSANSRIQWAQIESAPMTNTATFSANLANFGGFGFIAMNDNYGLQTNNEISFSNSYFIRSEKVTVGFGLQAPYSQITNDLSLLEPDVLNDPVLDDFTPQYYQPNFGVGFVIQSENFFLGLSVPRILDNQFFEDENISTYKRHYYISTGFKSELIDTKVQTLVRIIENKISVDVSATTFANKNLWFGLVLRDLGNFGVFSLLQLKDRFRLAATFEIPSDNISVNGVYEVTTSYTIAPFKRQKFEDRYF
jgi:type IX secretion system PorP/SprF family membrane protein